MKLKVLRILWKIIPPKKMTNSTEDYINQIELLKQALLFYGDKENYLFYENKDAPIALDEGSQARFALQRLEETINLNQEMEDEYLKEIREKIESNTPPENILRLIEEIKKVGNGDV
jgi:hypothetical protein